MCDIYYAKCKGCDAQIDMHLEDFATARKEVEVFCGEHIPDKDVRVFEMTGPKGKYASFRKGTRIGVRSLTKNAKKHAQGNHPNTAQSMSVVVIDRLGRSRKVKGVD